MESELGAASWHVWQVCYQIDIVLYLQSTVNQLSLSTRCGCLDIELLSFSANYRRIRIGLKETTDSAAI